MLPKLRKVDSSRKKRKYRLSDPATKRRMAINDGIKYEAGKARKTIGKARNTVGKARKP